MDQERKQFCCKEAAAFQSISDELQKLRSENEVLRAQRSRQGQKAGLPHLRRLGCLFSEALNNTSAEMRFDDFLAALIKELES